MQNKSASFVRLQWNSLLGTR